MNDRYDLTRDDILQIRGMDDMEFAAFELGMAIGGHVAIPPDPGDSLAVGVATVHQVHIFWFGSGTKYHVKADAADAKAVCGRRVASGLRPTERAIDAPDVPGVPWWMHRLPVAMERELCIACNDSGAIPILEGCR